MATLKWKDAEDQFEKYWKQFGKNATVYAFQDTREAMGTTGSRRVFTQSRPSDFLVTHDGHTFFAEVKSCSSHSSFAFSNIRDDQWKYAILHTAAKGLYLFYIKWEVNDQWYKVPASFLISLKNAGEKSVKWEALDEYRFYGI